MTASAGFSTMLLDRDRLERVLWGIWREYRRDFDLREITEIQDLRAFSILWAAVFIPEAVPRLLFYSMCRSIDQYRQREDYSTFGWYRALPIEAAIYAMFGDAWRLSTILLNLNHHKSSLRQFTTESFALVANRLEFDADALERIGKNLEWRHFYCEQGVILFAVSRATPEFKRRKIEEWLAAYSLNPDEQKALENLARGRIVENPFLHRALRAQQFLTLRLACIPEKDSSEPDPADEEDRIALETADASREQLKMFTGREEIFSQAVWDRISAHPLMTQMIEIADRPKAH